MLEDFPIKFGIDEKVSSPATNELFNVDNSKHLDKEETELYHQMVAKGLFVVKRGRPDIQPVITVLATRVKGPNMTDWNKLVRLMKWLNMMRNDVLTLRAGNLNMI